MVRLRLETPDGKLLGFEAAALESDRDRRPEMWGQVLETYQERILDHVCGPSPAVAPRSKGAL